MNLEGKQQSILTFRVGPVLCCAPSFPVQSIITPPKLTHPPGSDLSQPGIFKHGSHIVKVLDLRKKFGVQESDQTQPGNLIVTLLKNESVAFWVDQILDVFDFPNEGWGNLPAAIPRGAFSRTLLLNKKIHLYSEFEHLSTIHDLDYLKHYIQQLKQQENVPNVPAVTKQQKNTSLLSELPGKSNKIEKTIKIEEKNTPVVKNHITTKKTINKNSSTLATNTSRIKPIEPSIIEVKKAAPPPSTIQKPVEIKEKPKQSLERKYPAPIIKPPTSKSSTITIEDKEESSSSAIIFLFIIILLSFAAGVYYLFINTMSTDYKKTTFNTHHQENYNKKDKSIIETTELQNITSAQNDINSDIEDDNNFIINEKNIIESTSEINKENAATEKLKDESYQAKIVQQDNDITITLHQPTVKEKQLEPVIAVQQPDNKPTSQIIKTPPVIKEKVKPEEIFREIIHIVVKGDTLWAIAKKHVNDPFLYPELARLSKIKNPHRIYPGNRVRIRFIKY